MSNQLFRLLNRDIGIDLGTTTTAIARSYDDVLLREPSVVALDQAQEVVAVGLDAMLMLGRSPGSVHVVQPLSDGVISDPILCEMMLKHFIEKALGHTARRAGVRAVVCIPGCITEVEKRAAEEVAHNAGIRSAFLLDEPVAAALGAGMPIEEPMGSMVVDIGGGTTNCAVLALGGIVNKHTIRVGGNHIDETIAQYVKKNMDVSIGARMAEMVKLELASAQPNRNKRMKIRGQDQKNGLPRTLELDAHEIYQTIRPQLHAILSCVKEVLCATPPELASDIYDHGICLTGGGALLHGMSALIQQATGIHTHIAKNALDCVAQGAAKVMNQLEYYKNRAV